MKSIDEFARYVSNIEIIRVIRKGLLYMMPLVLIGSFGLMLLNLPLQPYQNAMNRLFGDTWRQVGLSVNSGTFRVISLTALLSVSYALTEEKKPVSTGEISSLYVILTAFACYMAFFWDESVVVTSSAAAATGMFGAIVIGLMATYLFHFFYDRIPVRIQLYSYDSDALLISSLRVLVPSMLTILSFALANVLMKLSGANLLVDALYNSMSDAFVNSGGGLLNAILFTLTTNLLWFFGLHGTNILDGIARGMFVPAGEINAELALQGLAPVNIITKEFFDAFVYMGGCGCTLGLMLALLLSSKASNVHRIARYSLPPGLFNINEMMVYGLPIIFNPYYLIPFLLTPAALCVTTYTAMRLGLVPMTIMRVEWTTPIVISGYVSTGSYAGILLQLVNVSLSTLIYLPFVRLGEANQKRKAAETFGLLRDEVFRVDRHPSETLLNRSDEVGNLSRMLASELHGCLYQGQKALHLEYQPKMNQEERIVGAEALLRWIHPVHGYISPPVILALSEEAGLDNKLGEWVLRSAFEDQRRWTGDGIGAVKLSANLAPRQLWEDSSLIRLMRDILDSTGIDPGAMELELTENIAVDQCASTREKLEAIHEMGISISIDDFGMGNSSLLYLRDFFANVVKIDISLVRGVTEDKNSQGIIHSIVRLCDELDVGLVAEGVETREQMEKLLEMGCRNYQGFLFSRSLPYDKFLEFAKNHGAAQSGQAENRYA